MTDVQRDAPIFTSDRAADPRLDASFRRLMRPDYSPGAVVAESRVSEWPGDVAGRLLLSLCRYTRAGFPALGRAATLAELMLRELHQHGYFGPAAGEAVDEQQLACHGWVVAGLIQYQAVTGDDRARRAAFRVIDELILPALANLDRYPRERDVAPGTGGAPGTAEFGIGDVAPGAGGAIGTATTEIGGWLLSTDTWCVFLVLNGLVPAFLDSGREDIEAMIRALGEELARLDLVAQRAQLHATLAAARCLSDYALATADKWMLDVAADIYGTYRCHARTLNYATYNWFGRPDSWTEPCAIVDSLAVAHNLRDATGRDDYGLDAVLIHRNALAFAERRDGSFGLDSVATPEHPELTPLHPDARWCCTIRGAIGLLEARERAIRFDSRSRTLRIDDPAPGLIRLDAPEGTWAIRIVVPGESGGVRLDVVSAPPEASPITAVSDGAGQGMLSPRPGTFARLAAQPSEVSEAVGSGLVRTRTGPLMLLRTATGDVVSMSDVAGSFDAGVTPVYLTAWAR